jgi:hypothetical protein
MSATDDKLLFGGDKAFSLSVKKQLAVTFEFYDFFYHKYEKYGVSHKKE